MVRNFEREKAKLSVYITLRPVYNEEQNEVVEHRQVTTIRVYTSLFFLII